MHTARQSKQTNAVVSYARYAAFWRYSVNIVRECRTGGRSTCCHWCVQYRGELHRLHVFAFQFRLTCSHNVLCVSRLFVYFDDYISDAWLSKPNPKLSVRSPLFVLFRSATPWQDLLWLLCWHMQMLADLLYFEFRHSLWCSRLSSRATLSDAGLDITCRQSLKRLTEMSTSHVAQRISFSVCRRSCCELSKS